MPDFDNVVIGAGIVGSFAALHLQKKGQKVLLIEQFPLPHTRGSSHGQSRMIRSCYKQRFFASLMPEACNMWKQLEKETNTEVFVNAGVLFIGKPGNNYETIKRNMDEFCPGKFFKIPSEQFSFDYPMLNFPEGNECNLDSTGGILRANKAVAAVQSLFKSLGGKIWDGCPVLDVVPGEVIVIKTSKCEIQTKSLVVCAGAWTSEIFKHQTAICQSLAPYVTPAAVRVFYWKEKEPQKYTKSSATFPAFLDRSSESEIYGLGSLEYPGLVKVCMHGGIPCDPNERDKAHFDPKIEAELKEYIREHLPCLELEPAIVEMCMYTLTPDESFIVDKFKDHENIVIGCGFSGTGFKTSPVIGKLLCELALGEDLSYDITNFRLERFNK